jgi:hypothetical protein
MVGRVIIIVGVNGVPRSLFRPTKASDSSGMATIGMLQNDSKPFGLDYELLL